jgi:protein ImuB
MVVCVHIPRFELIVAAGGAQAQAGVPLAIAPPAAGELRVGEVSGAAEAHGVRVGMALGEALARCPALRLVPADPLAVADAWECALAALEGIGAAVEPGSPGLAYFQADGLRGLYGSEWGAIGAARSALGRPARIGAAPTRFGAMAAALAASARRPRMVEAEIARFLSAQPVWLLGLREETRELVGPLDRLGIRTLGELAALGRDALCDRFGDPGAFAQRLAWGEDGPLQARLVVERLQESLDVGDASSGETLGRALGVLVDRLLARPERRGRMLRVLSLSALLAGGGAWRERVVLRQALSDSQRIRLALSSRLPLLPAPAQALRLCVECFGPPAGEQRGLLEQDGIARHERLREAVAQVRAAAGHDAALRAVLLDPHSRVPERRAALTPLPG